MKRFSINRASSEKCEFNKKMWLICNRKQKQSYIFMVINLDYYTFACNMKFGSMHGWFHDFCSAHNFILVYEAEYWYIIISSYICMITMFIYFTSLLIGLLFGNLRLFYMLRILTRKSPSTPKVSSGWTVNSKKVKKNLIFRCKLWQMFSVLANFHPEIAFMEVIAKRKKKEKQHSKMLSKIAFFGVLILFFYHDFHEYYICWNILPAFLHQFGLLDELAGAWIQYGIRAKRS